MPYTPERLQHARVLIALATVDDENPKPNLHRDWADQAEDDLAEVVPRAFFPWWANAAWCIVAASGACLLDPPALPLPLAAACVTIVFAWGCWLRRGPLPSLVSFWAASIITIAAFLAMLIVYVNEDSIVRTVWASISSAGLAYMLVMTLRRDALRGRSRAHEARGPE